MATIIKRFLGRARAIRPLRNAARDVFAAYADGANREAVIFLLADIGRRMNKIPR